MLTDFFCRNKYYHFVYNPINILTTRETIDAQRSVFGIGSDRNLENIFIFSLLFHISEFKTKNKTANKKNENQSSATFFLFFPRENVSTVSSNLNLALLVLKNSKYRCMKFQTKANETKRKNSRQNEQQTIRQIEM